MASVGQKSSQMDLNAFRRRIHRRGNVRIGLSHERQGVSPYQMPALIAYLGKQPIYKSVLAPITFPRVLNDYQKRARLLRINAAGEIVWTSCVLALFKDELTRFVFKKDEYYKAYLDEGAQEALIKLDEIEREFGISRWLLSHRFHLIQTCYGLQAQKDLLEQVMSAERLSEIIAWSAYYYSLYAEHNVSYSTIGSQLLELHGEIKDYFRNAIIPYEQVSIDDPGAPVSLDEPHCVIDRFETCIAMSIRILSKDIDDENRGLVELALKQLEGIGDYRIQSTLEVLAGEVLSCRKSCEAADAYTLGKYNEVIKNPLSPMELVVRANALLGDKVEKNVNATVRDQIISLMHDVVTMSSDSTQSKQKLKKISLSLHGHTAIYEIFGFLERNHDYMRTDKHGTTDRFAALGYSTHNPWNSKVLSDIANGGDWLSCLSRAHPNSPTLKLRKCLAEADDLGLKRELTGLPEYRRNAYLGHIAFMAGDFAEAVGHYSVSLTSANHYVAGSSRRYLYDAYIASGDIGRAIDLVLDHVFVTPGATQFYPLVDIAKMAMNQTELRDKISLAILLHLASRNSPKLERDLSDIYENVLASFDVDRPSMLPELTDDKSERLIYFLRYVCVPRILDDTTLFESVDEVEDERISVCQRLLQADPANKSHYLSEIRAITLEGKVSHLLNKVQTSKIYVDEGGIRQALEATLKDSFARYQQLRCSPELSYQAEKLTKRLTELLTAKGHPEFKGLKLPASEAESLFAQMLLEVGDEFALNPAYGLDTHVSTSIRHGAFEGHLRSPLAAEDLLCPKRDGAYALPDSWTARLSEVSEASSDQVTKALAKFTERFEDVVNSYLKGKLHIRTTSGNQSAMFAFDASSDQNSALMESITTSTDYDEFVDKLLTHCWSMTTASLENIRLDLSTAGSSQLAAAFDSLVRVVTTAGSHEQMAVLLDAIARARTSFQVALDDVCQWFYKPTDLSREPFEPEVAAHVALKQIENCYVKFQVAPDLDFEGTGKLDGGYLDGLCEILFILLQNAILHSGFQKSAPTVHLSMRLDYDSLLIICKNSLSSSVDLEERRDSVREASANYERDSALRMARNEGGSGLSKVWRIAEFDLRCDHRIDLSITDDRFYTATLKLSGLEKS